MTLRQCVIGSMVAMVLPWAHTPAQAQTIPIADFFVIHNSAVSGDGRFVAYVHGDGSIQLLDRHLGGIERVDLPNAGPPSLTASLCPAVSGSGRFVAFISYADNLVAGDTNGVPDVFVRDRLAGETTRESLTSAGIQSVLAAECPIGISGDGRYVTFTTKEALVPGDPNGARDVYVRDRTAGQTIIASVSSDEAFVPSGDAGAFPAISRNGRFVTFMTTNGDDLVGTPDTNQSHVVVRDLEAGETTLASRATGGAEGNFISLFPAISSDGRFVAFYSYSSNLVPDDDEGFVDAFVHDRQTGETARVSVSSLGEAGNADTGVGFNIPAIAISDNGRYVAFTSNASNLVPADTNDVQDVFVHDRLTARTFRASVTEFEGEVAGCNDAAAAKTALLHAMSASGGDLLFRSNHAYLPEPPTCASRIYLRRVWPASLGDLTGDRRAEMTVFRPGTGAWHSLAWPSGAAQSGAWGLSGDVPVAADYDGDVRMDRAVFRPSLAAWYVRHSWTNGTTVTVRIFGAGTDVPVPGDYDRDGKADLAVYRPSNGGWYVLLSSTNFTESGSLAFGAPGDIPVPGDYDGDRQTDLAVYRPSNGGWYVLQSSTDYTTVVSRPFGLATDRPVPGDYDGDGRVDFAVFRPSTGGWYALHSSTNNTTFTAHRWGTASDTPVPGDFDGDGITDIAVFRPSNGVWYVRNQFAVAWGTASDVPVLKR